MHKRQPAMDLSIDLETGWEAALALPAELALPAASPPPASSPPAKRIGVSPHKGRYDSQAWLGGRQHFLGAFANEDVAATAHDVAVVCALGEAAVGHTNAPLACYAPELEAFSVAAASGGTDVTALVQQMRERARQLSKARAPARALASWELEVSGAQGGMGACVRPPHNASPHNDSAHHYPPPDSCPRRCTAT